MSNSLFRLHYSAFISLFRLHYSALNQVQDFLETSQGGQRLPYEPPQGMLEMLQRLQRGGLGTDIRPPAR
jgi:hypothetical protein